MAAKTNHLPEFSATLARLVAEKRYRMETLIARSGISRTPIFAARAGQSTTVETALAIIRAIWQLGFPEDAKALYADLLRDTITQYGLDASILGTQTPRSLSAAQSQLLLAINHAGIDADELNRAILTLLWANTPEMHGHIPGRG